MIFLVHGLDRLVRLVLSGRWDPQASPTAVDPAAYVDAMGRAVNGVGIVTTDGPGGRLGITVSSVASVSAHPPLVATSINRRSPVAAAIERNRRFCVNLLAADDSGLADVFAGRPAEGPSYDFSGARWTEGRWGSPVLAGVPASFECVVHQVVRAGTHNLFIGRCVAVRTAGGPPLLYTGRRYGLPATRTGPRNERPEGRAAAGRLDVISTDPVGA